MSEADDRRPRDPEEFKGRRGGDGRRMRLLIPVVIGVVVLLVIAYLLAVGLGA